MEDTGSQNKTHEMYVHASVANEACILIRNAVDDAKMRAETGYLF
jgi:hypothetical protein